MSKHDNNWVNSHNWILIPLMGAIISVAFLFFKAKNEDYLKDISSFTEANARICVSNNVFLGDNKCVDKILALANAAGKKPYERDVVQKVLTRIELNKFIRASTRNNNIGYRTDVTESYCYRSENDAEYAVQEVLSVRNLDDINDKKTQAQIRRYLLALNCHPDNIDNAINYMITYKKLAMN